LLARQWGCRRSAAAAWASVWLRSQLAGPLAVAGVVVGKLFRPADQSRFPPHSDLRQPHPQARRDLRRLQQQLQHAALFDWQAWSHPSSTAHASIIHGFQLRAQLRPRARRVSRPAFLLNPRRRRHSPATETAASTWQKKGLRKESKPYLRTVARERQPPGGSHEQLDPFCSLSSESLSAAKPQPAAMRALRAAIGPGRPWPANWDSPRQDWGERRCPVAYGLHQGQFRQLPSDDDVQAPCGPDPPTAWRLA